VGVPKNQRCTKVDFKNPVSLFVLQKHDLPSLQEFDSEAHTVFEKAHQNGRTQFGSLGIPQ